MHQNPPPQRSSTWDRPTNVPPAADPWPAFVVTGHSNRAGLGGRVRSRLTVSLENHFAMLSRPNRQFKKATSNFMVSQACHANLTN